MNWCNLTGNDILLHLGIRLRGTLSRQSRRGVLALLFEDMCACLKHGLGEPERDVMESLLVRSFRIKSQDVCDGCVSVAWLVGQRL